MRSGERGSAASTASRRPSRACTRPVTWFEGRRRPMDRAPTPSSRRAKGRLEAFSDGVFAIAITLLVLEIAVPHVRGDRLLSGLLEQRPMYLAYFISFMTIGIVWIEHNALTDALDYVDAGFQRLNLLLLLFVGFLPFPTT